MTRKDDFLNLLYQEPDPTFVQALRTRWAAREAAHHARWTRRWRRVGVGLLVLLVLALSTLTVPEARARFLDYSRQVGGILFDLRPPTAYPEPEHPEVVLQPEEMPLEQALARFPYTVHLPTYIPQGFQMDKEHVLLTSGDHRPHTLEVFWWNPGHKSSISLLVCGNCVPGGALDAGRPVAEGALTEVRLSDGRPAVLIQGGWHLNTHSWQDDLGRELVWINDNQEYHLFVFAPAVTLEEMLNIASSTLP